MFRLVGLDFERLIPGFAVGIVPVVALTLVTFLHMALGEQAPKSLAIRSPRILAWSPRLRWFSIAYIFWPVIWLLNTASNLMLCVLGLGRPARGADPHRGGAAAHPAREHRGRPSRRGTSG